jgi:hypothetical protein
MADHGVICLMSCSGNVGNNSTLETSSHSLKTEQTAQTALHEGSGQGRRVRAIGALIIRNAGSAQLGWFFGITKVKRGIF